MSFEKQIIPKDKCATTISKLNEDYGIHYPNIFQKKEGGGGVFSLVKRAGMFALLLGVNF